MTKPRFFYDAKGRLRTLWRLLAFIALTAVFSIVLLAMVGIGAGGQAGTGALLVSQWAIVGGLMIAHLVMLKVIDPRPWSDVGLAREQATPRLVLGGMVLGAAAIAIPMGLLFGVDWLELAPAPDGSSLEFAALMLALFVPAALVEELMLRGYIFRALRDVWGWLPTLLVTSFVFAALHWFNPNGCVQTYSQGSFDAQTCAQSTLMVTLAGIFLGGVLVFTGSLYAAWTAHFAWNWTMTGVLHAAVSGAEAPIPGVTMPDFRAIDAGPDLVTGGSWGPEGGAAAALSMIVVTGWLWRRWRRREGAGAGVTT